MDHFKWSLIPANEVKANSFHILLSNDQSMTKAVIGDSSGWMTSLVFGPD